MVQRPPHLGAAGALSGRRRLWARASASGERNRRPGVDPSHPNRQSSTGAGGSWRASCPGCARRAVRPGRLGSARPRSSARPDPTRWRRMRDLNPRGVSSPTRFPIVRTRPLCESSAEQGTRRTPAALNPPSTAPRTTPTPGDRAPWSPRHPHQGWEKHLKQPIRGSIRCFSHLWWPCRAGQTAGSGPGRDAVTDRARHEGRPEACPHTEAMNPSLRHGGQSEIPSPAEATNASSSGRVGPVAEPTWVTAYAAAALATRTAPTSPPASTNPPAPTAPPAATRTAPTTPPAPATPPAPPPPGPHDSAARKAPV